MYPDAVDRQPVIDVVCKYAPSKRAEDFFSYVRSMLEGVGIELRYRVVRSGGTLLEFGKSAFSKAGERERAELCKALSHALSVRIRAARSFHEGVAQLIGELRDLGHDLWSFDESDDVEIWSSDYQQPSAPGIVVTFHPDRVLVEWSSVGPQDS